MGEIRFSETVAAPVDRAFAYLPHPGNAPEVFRGPKLCCADHEL